VRRIRGSEKKELIERWKENYIMRASYFSFLPDIT
jgi:hypothetical protein